MDSLAELLTKQAEIEKQIAGLRLAKHAEAVAQVKALVAESGLTAADIFGSVPGVKGAKLAKSAGKKVAPKYRDPVSGAQWSGRGMTPEWARGVDRNSLLIRDAG